MKRKVWLIAGTIEGRKIADALAALQVDVYVSVATAYGASLYPENPFIHVQTKRMTFADMCAFLREVQPDLVLDSTHPYAVVVTETIQKACRETGFPYKRMLRPASEHPGCITVKDFGEAIEILSGTEGPVFLTTGSKNLVDFTRLPDYAERITCRILPLRDSLDNALNLGYKPAQIICMQGPFAKDLNIAMFRRAGAKFIVSKDSGKAGGFEDKLEAAAEVGAKLILIDRNPETGEDLEQVLEELKEKFSTGQ